MATNSISRYFTAGEVACLRRGLHSLKEWGATALVPFRGFRLRDAKVVWINGRWFRERFFDPSDPSTRTRIESWVLAEFAYINPNTNHERNHVVVSDARTLFADRYGSSSGLAFHGGAGRAAVGEYFQAKGVGQTPLVSANAPPDHSHGCMSMPEAVREAIFGEIAAAEFPRGAVPIIAIIDVGFDYSSPDPSNTYDQHVRRAIVVRPLAVRFAHMERAPRFKHSIQVTANDQIADAARTRDFVNKWISGAIASNVSVENILQLRTSLDAVADQIAFGQVHRLFSGGYFSSNLTLSGELLDFGNMHALPDWSYAQVHRVAEGFGLEMSAIQSMVTSLCFYISKYKHLSKTVQSEAELYRQMVKTYMSSWKRYCLMLFQANGFPGSVKDGLHALLWQYYISQQKHWVRYHFGRITGSSTSVPRGWLYQGVVDRSCLKTQADEDCVLMEVDKLFRSNLSLSQITLAWRTAARLLKPRAMLDREKLLRELGSLVQHCAAPDFADRIDRYIMDAVDQGRRFWPRLPDGYGVRAHVARDGSSALLLYGCDTKGNLFWLEGTNGTNHTFIFFNERFSHSEMGNLRVCESHEHWSAIVRVTESYGKFSFGAPGRIILIPAPTVTYDPPDRSWIT